MKFCDIIEIGKALKTGLPGGAGVVRRLELDGIEPVGYDGASPVYDSEVISTKYKVEIVSMSDEMSRGVTPLDWPKIKKC